MNPQIEIQQNQECNILDFIDEFGKISLDPEKQIIRNPGILQKQPMPWQQKRQALFQFKEIYTYRLEELRKVFELDSIKTIEDLSSDEKVCELVGLFKRIEEKRVRAFEPQYNDKYQNHRPVFSPNDTYQLQDQTGKVKLQIRNATKLNGQGKFKAIQTPYGVIVKCKGLYSPKINRFILSNVQTPKPAPQQKLIPLKGESKYMVVMSEPTVVDLRKMLMNLRLSQSQLSQNLSQVVIIGGLNYKDVQQVRQFDQAMYELGAIVDIFLVPSCSEQTSYIYPQLPVTRTLLQKSYNKSNVANCSNPQMLTPRDQNTNLTASVSCGQNLLNLKANCQIKNDLQLMKLILEYRHMCPSSIFSLPIQSYNYDPLIINQTPHLMIHGKCQIFNSDLWQRETQNGNRVQVRLVALAAGDKVKIDLTSSTLNTEKFQF